MSSSPYALPLNLVSFVAYGYSIYFMFYDENLNKMSMLLPQPLRVYGHFKFLTFQCLLIQFLNSILHLGALFSRVFVKPRDLIFTTLAFPVGCMVVYSFWAIWYFMGRELIFPVEVSKYYPDWLNHVTHTIIAPINILSALVINHKFIKNGALITLAYCGSYTVFLHVIKAQTGHFVYKYLDVMKDTERHIYFVCTGLVAYLICKSGQLLTDLAHKEASQRPALKKTKQK